MGYISPRLVSISFGHGSITPWVNGTTYYFAKLTGGPATTVAVRSIPIPSKGIITGFIFEEFCGTTTGSNEAWPMVLRVNDTTDYTIDTQSLATPSRTWRNLSLNIPVNSGDLVVIKSVTPAWATPPSGGIGQGTLIIETG